MDASISARAGASSARARVGIPWPVTILGLVLVAIGAYEGLSKILAPAGAVPGLSLDNPQLALLIGQTGARNLSMAAVLLAALLTRSRQALGFVFGMRVMTEALDTYFVVTTGAIGAPAILVLVGMLGIFVIPEVLSAAYLLRGGLRSNNRLPQA